MLFGSSLARPKEQVNFHSNGLKILWMNMCKKVIRKSMTMINKKIIRKIFTTYLLKSPTGLSGCTLMAKSPSFPVISCPSSFMTYSFEKKVLFIKFTNIMILTIDSSLEITDGPSEGCNEITKLFIG